MLEFPSKAPLFESQTIQLHRHYFRHRLDCFQLMPRSSSERTHIRLVRLFVIPGSNFPCSFIPSSNPMIVPHLANPFDFDKIRQEAMGVLVEHQLLLYPAEHPNSKMRIRLTGCRLPPNVAAEVERLRKEIEVLEQLRARSESEWFRALEGVRDPELRKWTACVIGWDFRSGKKDSLIEYGETVNLYRLQQSKLVESLKAVGYPNPEARVQGRPLRRELLRILKQAGQLSLRGARIQSVRRPPSGPTKRRGPVPTAPACYQN